MIVEDDQIVLGRFVGEVERAFLAVVWFFGLGLGAFVNKFTLGDGGC